MTVRILYLITARGGSKRLPGKNVRALGGHPLIGYKVVSAKAAESCTRLIVSTDDAAIADAARAYGAEVPFMRPAELATDTAASSDVVLHAMDWIEENEGRPYDAVMLLEPTTPFARAADYEAAVALFQRTGAALVIGTTAAAHPSVFQGPLTEDGRAAAIIEKFTHLSDTRGQAFEDEYLINGAFYLARWSQLRETGQLYGDPENTYAYVMDRFHSVNIDTEDDFLIAESFLESALVDSGDWAWSST